MPGRSQSGTMLDTTMKATAAKAETNAAPNFAAGLQDFASEPASDAAAPIVMPVTVDQVARPPKPAPAPSSQVDAQRVLDAKGNIIGLDFVPLPGNAIVRIELRDLSKDKRWRVKVFTAPRRGRTFREQRPRSPFALDQHKGKA
jgi:hypothetical protein